MFTSRMNKLVSMSLKFSVWKKQSKLKEKWFRFVQLSIWSIYCTDFNKATMTMLMENIQYKLLQTWVKSWSYINNNLGQIYCHLMENEAFMCHIRILNSLLSPGASVKTLIETMCSNFTYWKTYCIAQRCAKYFATRASLDPFYWGMSPVK